MSSVCMPARLARAPGPVLDFRARLPPSESMLRADTVLARDGIAVADVACRHTAGRGDEDEHSARHGIVFVRRGCFVRVVEGAEELLDATAAYCMNPGAEVRYDHPHDDGDDCTALFLSPRLAAALWGGDPQLPARALRTSSRIDLEHRLLLAAARRGEDPDEQVERAIALGAAALEGADARRVAAGRPATARARRALADGAREALVADPDRSLLDLAGALAVSPHHLSRVFASVVGHTISRHRMILRARAALERVAGGERDLARLAADVGFADQSHLARVVRRETGRPPSALRALLA
jgi:AraC-like DNA-binding protein